MPMLQWLVLLLCLWYLAMHWDNYQVRQAATWFFSTAKTQWLMFTLVALLMPVNLGLEIAKWRLQTAPLGGQTWLQATKGVLAGLSLSLFAPQMVGELGGRFLHFKGKGRVATAGAWAIGNWAQTLATLSIGFTGLMVLALSQSGGKLPIASAAWVMGVVIMLLVFALWFMQAKWLPWMAARLPYAKWKNVWLAWQLFKPSTRWTILLLSVFRYLVFATQLTLLLSLLVAAPWWLLAAVVATSYLVKAVLPILSLLGDIALRVSALLLACEWAGLNPSATVALASMSIWVLNLLVPAVCGAPFILTPKTRFGKKLMNIKG